MRFIYVDSRGNEVEVASVEALAARIQLGAIVPETRLYDEAADLWAPAEAHPVYRQILREGVEPGQSMGRVSTGGEMPGDPGPTTTREDAKAASDAVTSTPNDVPRTRIPGLVGHTGTTDGTSDPVSDVVDIAGVHEPASIDDLAPTDSTGPAKVVGAPGDDLSNSSPERGVSAPTAPAPAPTPYEPDAFDLGLTTSKAESGGGHSGPASSPAPDPESEPVGVGPEPPGWSREGSIAPRERHSFASTSDSASTWDGDASGDEPSQGPPSGVVSADAATENAYIELTSLGETFEKDRAQSPNAAPPEAVLPAPLPRVRSRGFWDLVDSRTGNVAFLVAALLVMLAFGTSGEQAFFNRSAWVLGGVAAAAGVSSLALYWNRRNHFLIPPTTLVLVAVLSGFLIAQRNNEQATTEALADLERAVADLDANRGGGDANAPVDSLPLFPEIPEDISGAAFQTMTDVMREYQSVLGLPDAPPRSWLEGIYLASASRFPGVAEYWEGAHGYILDLREMEDSLYKEGIEWKVAEVGLTAADLGPAGERRNGRLPCTGAVPSTRLRSGRRSGHRGPISARPPRDARGRHRIRSLHSRRRLPRSRDRGRSD